MRRELNITMSKLADKTGYSQSYLSQVERDIIQPSIGALQKISRALNLPVAIFFENTDAANLAPSSSVASAAVVRSNQRKGFTQPGSEVVYQLLSPNLQGELELLYITAEPGASSGADCFIHNGHEGGVVISGVLEYQVADQIYTLYPGDSIYFDSSLPHCWKSIGEEPLISFWAITPPSF